MNAWIIAALFIAIAFWRGAHLEPDESVAPPVVVVPEARDRLPPERVPSDRSPGQPRPPDPGSPPTAGQDPGELPWPPTAAERCVFRTGTIAFRWEYAPGEALATRIPLTGRTVRAVQADLARAYTAWAVTAGTIGADMFVRKARGEGVTIRLGEPVGAQAYLPIAGIQIDRPCP